MLCVQLGGRDACVIKKGLAEIPVPSNLMVGTSKVRVTNFNYFESVDLVFLYPCYKKLGSKNESDIYPLISGIV